MIKSPKEILEQIKKATKPEEYKKLLEIISSIKEEDNNLEYLYFAKGEIYFRMQQWGKAINNYQKALEINPENKEVSGKINLLKEILKFHNTDIYASTNTNMDPWLDD